MDIGHWSSVIAAKRVAYLFARYPVPSQTFCDTEMRALEALGWELEVHVVSPPLTSFRHGRDTRPAAPVFHAPHGRVLDRLEARARRAGQWPTALIAEHEARFGPRHVPARRARHALYFAELCRQRGVGHVHVHFAADAVHTALFLESFGGPTFSFTAHGQDFMLDLANDDLLREMAARARFVVAVSDWSRSLLREKCPASAEKIVRVYNGLTVGKSVEPAAHDFSAPSQVVEDDSREIKIDPQGITGVPREITGDPQGITGDPQGITGDPREITGDPRTITRDPREITGDPRTITKDPREITGDPRTITGDPRAITDRPGALTRPPRLLSVGRVIEFKGFHVLIAACAELARRGLDFVCEIIGEGPWRGELERLVREHALADRVLLPGLRDQAAVRAAMRGCDVFALACVVDGDGACDVLPTVILEAMAAGKPVVSTTLAGVPELVVDGETGRLAPPGDAPALADALAELFDDPARRAAFGHAGRLRLEQRFRAEDSARQLGNLFPVSPSPRLPVSPSPRLLLLLADCPPDSPAADAGRLPAELRRLRERLAEDAPAVLRVVCLQPPSRRLDPDALAAGRLPEADPWWLDALDRFLPDGMVLEAEWRERADVAHRLEAGHETSPGSLSTEEFLLQARRALWLFTTFWETTAVADAPRHVHAEGRGALLCAALLRRLAGGAATASFSIPGGRLTSELPGSALRRLAGEFAGGRVENDAPLVRALGEWPVELAGDGDGFVKRLLGWIGYHAPRPHAAEIWDD